MEDSCGVVPNVDTSDARGDGASGSDILSAEERAVDVDMEEVVPVLAEMPGAGVEDAIGTDISNTGELAVDVGRRDDLSDELVLPADAAMPDAGVEDAIGADRSWNNTSLSDTAMPDVGVEDNDCTVDRGF